MMRLLKALTDGGYQQAENEHYECRECGFNLSPDANECPHCGGDVAIYVLQ